MAGAHRFGRQWEGGKEDRGAAPLISSAASNYTKYSTFARALLRVIIK
jgi:hypothetical protein